MLPILGLVLLGIGLVPIWLAPASELLALLRRSARARTSRDRAPARHDPARLVFLVPAHDEEAMIGRCVRSLIDQDYASGALDIVVIADNCSDRTAELARGAGARCLERHDPEHSGKPRAIAWALAQLPLDEWDLCIIIDADTITDRDFARALSDAVGIAARDRVMQAYNGIMNESETWLTRLSGLHTRIRYESQYLLKRAVGLNCPLAGNGMCFGTNVLASMGWTAFSIGEDCELYAQYTLSGIEIGYASDARVYAAEASALRRAGTQRRRWMAGRVWVAKTYFGQILTSQRINGFQKLDLLGELVTPGPVLQGVLAFAIAFGAFRIDHPLSWPVAAVSLVSLAPLGWHTLHALIRHPDPWRTLASFLFLPPYAVWRSINAVWGLSSVGDRTWRRADRDTRVDIDNGISDRVSRARIDTSTE